MAKKITVKTNKKAVKTNKKDEIQQKNSKGEEVHNSGSAEEIKYAFPIIGIGASAGGMDALEKFLSHMPPQSGMAFVVVQHLDPTHKSLMGDLLQKYTTMKVLTVKEGMRIERDCVYFNPSDKEVSLVNGSFRLTALPSTRGFRLPIDHFLRSLAEDQAEDAMCIILSGTGTDGTLGLKEIKGAGGMTMAQDISQAQYSGMPKSAIDTGLVDYILPVERMPEELIGYVKHPYLKAPEEIETVGKKFGDYVQKIFALIRSKTGNDFSNYKQNTIRRRIERRMAVHKVIDLGDYVRYLYQQPSEVDALFKDFLIKVTNFFRDREAFDVLAKNVIPSLLEHREAGSNVRIWVPGCASGEEAYSIAMLMMEGMDKAQKQLNVQVFATDIDTEAIEYGRMAQYLDSIAADVSEERLKHFFIKEGDTYRVKKEIRQMVVFAVQNLTSDPPFSKLDLVSCRNLLIYMEPLLQKKIIPLFHYTLNEDGYLFLGSSESVGEYSNFFTTISKKWKIYQRKGSSAWNAPDYSPLARRVGIYLGRQDVEEKQALKKLDVRELAVRITLADYALPSVLIDKEWNILYFRGSTDKYLMPPTGEPSFNILDMAREELRYQLRIALHKAARQKKPVVSEGISIKTGDEYQTVNVVVRPLVESAATQNLIMVIFEEKTPPVRPVAGKNKKAAEGAEINPQITILEQKLQATKEDLQTTIEELETSNEELKSANEELQSSNEEAQSTNEELETSREELQSTNEELITVNSELQNKVEELSQANNDINNLLASTEIGTIFLNSELKIRRFTPAINRIFNLIPADIGRPITDLTPKILQIDLKTKAQEVLDTLESKEEEEQSKDGTWLSIRIRPYRTVENIIDGVVVTFIDVTNIKRSEQLVRSAQIYAESIVETLPNPLLILDRELRVVSANRSFYKTFQASQKETENIYIYDLGNGQWDIPRLRKLFDGVIAHNRPVSEFEVSHNFPNIGRKTMLLNARPFQHEGEHSPMVLVVIQDITERKQAAEALREARNGLEIKVEERTKALQADRQRLFSLMDGLPAFVKLQSPDYSIRFINRYFRERFGEPDGRPCYEVLNGRKDPCEKCQTFRVFETKSPQQWEWISPDGRIYEIYDYPYTDTDGSPLVLELGIDTTERKEADEALRKQVHDLSKRVRELNCLYGISNLAEQQGLSLEEILQGTVDLIPQWTVDLIPPAWPYRKIACARIILENQEYGTKNFKQTDWKQASDLMAHDHRIGSLEVFYLEEKPESDEGPFMKEEKNLLNAIAGQVGRIIERKA